MHGVALEAGTSPAIRDRQRNKAMKADNLAKKEAEHVKTFLLSLFFLFISPWGCSDPPPNLRPDVSMKLRRDGKVSLKAELRVGSASEKRTLIHGLQVYLVAGNEFKDRLTTSTGQVHHRRLMVPISLKRLQEVRRKYGEPKILLEFGSYKPVEGKSMDRLGDPVNQGTHTFPLSEEVRAELAESE